MGAGEGRGGEGRGGEQVAIRSPTFILRVVLPAPQITIAKWSTIASSRSSAICRWPKRLFCVVLTSASVEKILSCYFSNKNALAVVLQGAFHHFTKWYCGFFVNFEFDPPDIYSPDILRSRSISRWWSWRILLTWSLCVVKSSCRRLFILAKLFISSFSLTCFTSRRRLCSSFSFTATSWFSNCRLRFSSTLLSF